MNATVIAAIEVFVIAAGAFASIVITRRVARAGDRKVLLMAAVTAWTILFGLIPFFLFALFARRTGASSGISPLAAVVLNFIPFGMIAAPLIGFAQGLLTKSPAE